MPYQETVWIVPGHLYLPPGEPQYILEWQIKESLIHVRCLLKTLFEIFLVATINKTLNEIIEDKITGYQRNRKSD